MKTEENKRMLTLSYIVDDLKAENMEFAQDVQLLGGGTPKQEQQPTPKNDLPF